MANAENLRKFGSMSKEERVEIARRGGLKSAETKRKKKAMREQAQMLLSLPVKKSKVKDKLKELGIKNDDITNQMALIVAIYHKALQGDVQAASWIRDLIGEKPVDKYSVEGSLPVVIMGEDDLVDGDDCGANKG